MADASPPSSARRRRARWSPVGSPPGTLIADPKAEPTRLRATVISPEGRRSIDSVALGDIAALRSRSRTLWLDCIGLRDVELIAAVGEMFGLHRLALEDVVNIGQRPKVDLFEDHAFVVLKMIDRAGGFAPEQLSLFFGDGFVLTFQEREGDSFDPVRKRIEAGGGMWKRKADYLAYALIDAVVDGYFPLLDARSDAIDRIEDAVLAGATREQTAEMHRVRREMILAKRWLWPVRDAIGTLMRAEGNYLSSETKVYLNDTYDHAVRLIEIMETDRDTLTGLIELHLSMMQAKTNEVINLLTIVSTIFIPLTFLVGVWGMNFGGSPWNMPELEWYYGYPAALLLMLAIAVALVTYFRWKKWL